MEMKITFPGGKRVDAELNNRVISTDQPPGGGGEGSAPAPYDYFLASLGTCAGIYVLSFCQERGISTEGLALTQRMEFAVDGGKSRLAKVDLEITLPSGFPVKYHNAIIKSAELCSVKKALMNPPDFEISIQDTTNKQMNINGN
ncbi:MAG: osmotically inducible protein OsmC [Geobacteraceae bacterium GWC2_55_20]|nr:MAG: osmotically inducible protein OsmC [Geobacteraceae bacterium GWC2_55_20]OGU19298.1 MAG: osmotically inducible protein OsmC [Geobacteraceae bacterium GWF2_54_21]HBA73665.1 osmotically inducible protein OsmC [Geobacter sp.]HCE68441.1 osmotically inducible protein OsmC [Geobacter sp.]